MSPGSAGLGSSCSVAVRRAFPSLPLSVKQRQVPKNKKSQLHRARRLAKTKHHPEDVVARRASQCFGRRTSSMAIFICNVAPVNNTNRGLISLTPTTIATSTGRPMPTQSPFRILSAARKKCVLVRCSTSCTHWRRRPHRMSAPKSQANAVHRWSSQSTRFGAPSVRMSSPRATASCKPHVKKSQRSFQLGAACSLVSF